MKPTTVHAAFTLLTLMMFTSQVISKEQANTAPQGVKVNKITISPVTDKAKPESNKSKAQERALQSNINEKVNISDAKPKHEADLIDGLILSRAMTRFGHRFYREFVSAYREINGTNIHSGLTIVEQATARSGSKILVLHNRKPIFITFVSPASRSLDAQTDIAAKQVNDWLLHYQQQSKWSAFLDPDLASDEF